MEALISRATIIFIFMLPKANQYIAPLLKKFMPKGGKVVSAMFKMTDLEEYLVAVSVNFVNGAHPAEASAAAAAGSVSYEHEQKLYLYVMSG